MSYSCRVLFTYFARRPVSPTTCTEETVLCDRLGFRLFYHYKKFAILRPSILVTEWSWLFIRDLSVTKNSWSTAERH